jgi:hypothetical protein
MPCYGMQYSNYAAGDYYRGDYYRGDYYRGDPFIHKKIIGGIKTVAKAVSNVLVPAPIRKVAELVGGHISSDVQRGFAPPMLPPPTGMGPPLPYPYGGGGPPLDYRYCFTASGKPGRLNKSGYYTKFGYVPPRSKCVPNRRMNVANPRALRRALRRAQGFSKLARRFITVAQRFKKTGRKRKR